MQFFLVRESLASDILAGDGKIANLFYIVYRNTVFVLFYNFIEWYILHMYCYCCCCWQSMKQWNDIFIKKFSGPYTVWNFTEMALHCINSKSYIAQKSVSINSGPDSIVMNSFIGRYCFCQSSKMMMNTSLFNSIWHAEAIYSREIHRSWLY